jgi:uncharacterized protein
MGGMGNPSNASMCKKCKKCEAACPQKIPIPDELIKVSKTLDGLSTKVILMIAKRMFSSGKEDE